MRYLYYLLLLCLIGCSNNPQTKPSQPVLVNNPCPPDHDTIGLFEGINTDTIWLNSKPDGYISIADIGCKPNDESVDNGKIINDYCADKIDHVDLYIPMGAWYSYTTINSANKTINLVGAGRYVTQWKSHNGSAYLIYRSKYKDSVHAELNMNPVTIKGIAFQCQDNTGDPKALDLAGLRIYHIAVIEDVSIVGYFGGGLQMYGELTNGQHCNVSGSRVVNVQIANIKGNAVFIVGPDANACVFESMDIRDCTGIAVSDNSFLGNYWRGIMMHACDRSVNVENVTAKSSFIGCYHETGQKLPMVVGKEVPPFEGMFTLDLGVITPVKSTTP